MGKNIVLLHGWGAETKKLIPLKKELKKLGWSVFLPKLPGFELPSPETVWGIQEYSDYIKKEAAGVFKKEKYFVFGHSFGGGIAIKTAKERNIGLEGIILCASRGISRGKSIKRLVFIFVAKVGKIFLLTPKLGKKFKKFLYKAAREHDYEKLNGIMREVFKKVISEDLKPEIGKIKIPVLILWGRDDRMTPASDALYLKKKLKLAKMKLFPKQGHKLPYKMPKALAKEINLWQATHLT